MNEEKNEVEMKENIQNKEDKSKANNLCILSILLNFVPPLLTGVFSSIFNSNLNGESFISSVIFKVLYFILGVCPTAAFIIIIYVRIKYPKNTFGKVLMIFYIVGIIIYIFLFVAILVTCSSALNEMRGCY